MLLNFLDSTTFTTNTLLQTQLPDSAEWVLFKFIFSIFLICTWANNLLGVVIDVFLYIFRQIEK